MYWYETQEALPTDRYYPCAKCLKKAKALQRPTKTAALSRVAVKLGIPVVTVVAPPTSVDDVLGVLADFETDDSDIMLNDDLVSPFTRCEACGCPATVGCADDCPLQ